MRVTTDVEYVAQYSARDRAIGPGRMAFFAALLVYRASRSARVIGCVVSGGFFCFFAWYAILRKVTSVKSPCERIVARLPLFREVSERYADVVQPWFPAGSGRRIVSAMRSSAWARVRAIMGT